MIVGLFAVDDVGSIGYKGGMPWPPNKEDFKWFRETTLNQVVVMGSTTWSSPDMPKPLPNRTNIVISRNTNLKQADAVLQGDVPKLINGVAREYYTKDIFVIGGANILLQAKPALEKLYITRIPGIYDSDTQIDLKLFLHGFKLINVKDLITCKVEEYINETIS